MHCYVAELTDVEATMGRYCVNKNPQSSGEREVHKRGCVHYPRDYIDLGVHSTCQSAIREARRHYANVDGCFYCSPACHTK